MIPKVIHYCWFGKKEKSSEILKCIESWKKYCPDYDIVEWNEDNFDVECIPFVKKAYSERKWAFVSDYARLKIVYENGGIYLDTDVELIKPLDDLLSLDCYMGIQKDGCVATGLGFGALKGHEVLRALMYDYHNREFLQGKACKTIACPIVNTEVLKKYGYIQEDKTQSFAGVTVFSSEYFDPKDCETYILNTTENTYSIHHYDATWKTKNSKRRQVMIKTVVKLLGENNYLRLKNFIKNR